LNYFKENTHADFYFKRSYHEALLANTPENCKVFPLGFNYYMKPKGAFINKHYNNSLRSRTKQYIKQHLDALGVLRDREDRISSKSFENHPVFNPENKILFLTRLWNPEDTDQLHYKALREKINADRIAYINACKKEFGSRFTGGLLKDDFSIKVAKELVLSDEISKKRNYLKAVKEHNICIATTGLHNSIGWEMGEYIAASRAIVSEKLYYDVTGNFTLNENYLDFDTKERLLSQLEELLTVPSRTKKMMENNYTYYTQYLEPEMLIINTLKIITKEI